MNQCVECKRDWYSDHADDCSIGATRFLQELRDTSWASSDHFPRCPHCGYGDDFWYEGVGQQIYDGTRLNMTCARCERDYPVTVAVTYNFNVEAPAQGMEAGTGETRSGSTASEARGDSPVAERDAPESPRLGGDR